MSNAIAGAMPNNTPGRTDRTLADLQRQIDELRAARTLDLATITAIPGMGIRTGDFDGTNFANPGTVGNYFGGDGAVLNALYLRPGSVSNDALTNPILPGIGRASATNFGLAAGALNELAGIDLTVPAGCSQLLATCTSRMYAVNPNTTGGSNGTGGDAWYVTPKIGTQSSVATPTPVSGGNGYNTAVCTDAFTITGLSAGSTIRLSVQGGSAFQSVAATSANYAVVAAELKWLR